MSGDYTIIVRSSADSIFAPAGDGALCRLTEALRDVLVGPAWSGSRLLAQVSGSSLVIMDDGAPLPSDADSWQSPTGAASAAMLQRSQRGAGHLIPALLDACSSWMVHTAGQPALVLRGHHDDEPELPDGLVNAVRYRIRGDLAGAVVLDPGVVAAQLELLAAEFAGASIEVRDAAGYRSTHCYPRGYQDWFLRRFAPLGIAAPAAALAGEGSYGRVQLAAIPLHHGVQHSVVICERKEVAAAHLTDMLRDRWLPVRRSQLGEAARGPGIALGVALWPARRLRYRDSSGRELDDSEWVAELAQWLDQGRQQQP